MHVCRFGIHSMHALAFTAAWLGIHSSTHQLSQNRQFICDITTGREECNNKFKEGGETSQKTEGQEGQSKRKQPRRNPVVITVGYGRYHWHGWHGAKGGRRVAFALRLRVPSSLLRCPFDVPLRVPSSSFDVPLRVSLSSCIPHWPPPPSDVA